MKNLFTKAIQRWLNYYSHMKKRNDTLEKVFGEETSMFDFVGVEELLSATVDMAFLMFPKLNRDEIEENICWYVYEAVDMENPEVSDNDKTWIVNTPEDLFAMLKDFNDKN